MNILPKSNHVVIYTGSKINSQFLQQLLLKDNIKSVVRDDSQSGLSAGFGIDYVSESRLFVDKEDSLKAKHIVSNAVDEEGNLRGVDNELLMEQAMADRPPLRRQENTKEPYRRSSFNLVLNFVIIAYSLFRLYPLAIGEELPTWRIALSSGLIIFCAVAIINHYKKSPSS